MRVPDVLHSLTDQGVLDAVLRPLKSGKEAEVFLVEVGGDTCVAKVYKDAQQRSFKARAEYMEGRRVRSSRDQRAMDRRTRYGRERQEGAWKAAEVEVIYRLHAQGVRVPTPINFIDGVLIMELVRGADGGPAPRLAEVRADGAQARAYFDHLLREVVKMLCAGIVHGDLSDYNVLVDAEGPVIIDFPQAVDASQNRNARKLLVRDVDNLSAYLARCAPGTRRRPYGEEIWSAYESNLLTPDLELKGTFRATGGPTHLGSLLDEIADAESDELRRRGERPSPRRREASTSEGASEGPREAKGPSESGPPPRRREVIVAGGGGEAKRHRRQQGGSRGDAPESRRGNAGEGSRGEPGARSRRRPNGAAEGHREGSPERRHPADSEAREGRGEPGKRRRRRRRKMSSADGEAPLQVAADRPRSESAAGEGGGAKRRRRRRKPGAGEGAREAEPRRRSEAEDSERREPGAKRRRRRSGADAGPRENGEPRRRSEGAEDSDGREPGAKRRRRRPASDASPGEAEPRRSEGHADGEGREPGAKRRRRRPHADAAPRENSEPRQNDAGAGEGTSRSARRRRRKRRGARSDGAGGQDR